MRVTRRFVLVSGLVVAGVGVAFVGPKVVRRAVNFIHCFEHLRVPPGKVAILLRHDGRTLPPGAFVAPPIAPGEPPYQGVQEEVLPPGDHPNIDRWGYDWEIVPLTEVPSDKVGVVVRMFGEPLPPGQTLADENPADAAAGIVRRGILREPLAAGSHLINTRAYHVLLFDPVVIEPGQVGVVAHLVGKNKPGSNELLSQPDERGVQGGVLPPGIHHVNPFATFVVPVSRQSQRVDLTTPGARVRFPTSDGFDIGLDGTIEWGLPDAAAPIVYVKFGNTKVVEDNLIVPAARATSRLFGARSPARDFITGTSRQEFQTAFEAELRRLVENEGPVIHAVTVSGIVPPTELADLIQKRVDATLARALLTAQMETERGRASLLREQELEKRPALLAKARADGATKGGAANEERSKALAAAHGADEQASIELEVAKLAATRIVADARGFAQAKAEQSAAAAARESALAEAVGGGAAYAKLCMLEQLVPRFRSVVSSLRSGPLESFTALALGPGATRANVLPTDASVNSPTNPNAEKKP